MMLSHARSGYIFLITILVVGVIASATATSLLLLGWAAEQNGQLMMQSAQSYEYAQTCVERALREVRADNEYGGGETIVFDLGECDILPLGGSGSADRTICAEGRSGESTRRIEVDVSALYPSAVISSWQEVPTFTLCL